MKGIEKSKSKLREIETLKTLNILANMLVEEIKEIYIRYRKYLKYKSRYYYKMDNLRTISVSQDM